MTLRKRLQQITDTMPADEHFSMLQDLTPLTQHSINIVNSHFPVNTYTCVIHAFGLIEDPTYLSVAGFGLGRTFAGAEFIHYLLDHGFLLEIQLNEVSAGDLVIYIGDNTFRHVGTILNGGRVLSKWGTGHLYDHSLWEVPSSYGESVRYFRKLKLGEGLDLFVVYAESKGFKFE